MTKLYKLTDQSGQTRNATQWGPGVTHEASGEGELCGHGWLHAYTHPLLAALLNPIHANFQEPVLWEAEGEIWLYDHGLKVGCRKLTTLRQIPLPAVTLEQRVEFGIRCALSVYTEHSFRAWAERWLSGDDRSYRAAAIAASTAAAAAERAAWKAAAEWSAAEATAEATAAAAEWSAAAAATAAAAAARAAHTAPLDLIAIAEMVCGKYEVTQ